MAHDKRHLRLALRLHAAYRHNITIGRYAALAGSICRLESHWDSLNRNLKRIATAINRGWLGAAGQQICCSHYEREEVERQLKELSESVYNITQSRGPDVCDVAYLCEDIKSIESEFADIGWDTSEVWVTTEPISLEGIYLGAFEIHLPFSCLGGSPGSMEYRIVATDPHPSAKRDDVVHPHVESGHLCEGDATSPISRSLEQGRLLDFFQIVRSVLNTYNADSPYVKLENWEDGGIQCADCGYDVDEDESSFCEACQSTYCGECIYGCSRCSDYVCRGCSVHCPSCEERYCGGCMLTCSACKKELCNGCVNDDGICESCEEEQQAQEGISENEESTQQPQTSKEGEVAISAAPPATSAA
jgi:hypothetical protein